MPVPPKAPTQPSAQALSKPSASKPSASKPSTKPQPEPAGSPAPPPRKRYASSVDVARLAGVSQSAVSRTYTAGASVSAATRDKVLAAAATLGYRPSAIPQIMLTHRSNLVAIVAGRADNPFYARTLQRFATGLQERGHQVLLVQADSGHTLDGAIPRLVSYRVDAIISALAILSPQAVAELSRLAIPTVSFNTPVHNDWIASVCSDNVAAGRAVADLLAGQGARRLAFVAGPQGSPASQERLAGFAGRLAELGLDPPAVAPGEFCYEGGLAAGMALLAGHGHSGNAGSEADTGGRMQGLPQGSATPLPASQRPDAVFCANDLMAMGLADAARHRLGLAVPQDLRIVGFDDIPQAAWDAYRLTSVRQDEAAMTQHTFDLLTRAMTHHAGPGNQHIIVPTIIIQRETA